jgi:molybdopterin-biosynthesis enzyme MoeA-like protein
MLTTEQTRHLNLMMPLGYIIAPKTKLFSQNIKKRESIMSEHTIRKERKPPALEQKQSEVPEPIKRIPNPIVTKCKINIDHFSIIALNGEMSKYTKSLEKASQIFPLLRTRRHQYNYRLFDHY